MTRRPPTTWMWAEACALLEEAERLHRQFFAVGAARAGAGPVWEAPVDVFEHGGELTVWVALPGVAPESVEVVLDGGRLQGSGVRHLRVEPRAVIRRLEIPHGRLERTVELPGNAYVVDATGVAHGCVRLRLRRA